MGKQKSGHANAPPTSTTRARARNAPISKSQDKQRLIRRARSLASGLRWRRGNKSAFVRRIIQKALNAPCPYCGDTLTLKTISLDHKIPFENSRARKEIKTHYKLDIAKNLHIVCRRCNNAKGNLSHEQFLRLVRFLNSDPLMKRSVLKRLSMGQSYYRFNRTRKV